ncbi:MAG TPA: sigma-70 family RNA polymerase sigma factor [Jatrophihabitans sp.]|jgi:RNA polymerase sigma-70 factor (ECF subfamily)|nr:sigma-70 family RNA polymerase sigma factor [Jatrophihabitans sp.]
MQSADEAEFAQRSDPHRRELLVHCYRMLGSFHDAEDAVQETYLRAWRAYPQFEGRASMRTWLYRIATNACLTALENKGRRMLPSGLGGPSADGPYALADRRTEIPWLEPLPDSAVSGGMDDPAAVAVRRESTRLAFVAALQQLPARQRAALLLRDVLDMSAADTADVLDMTVPAVTSALQRARAQLAGNAASEEEITVTSDVDERLLDQYVQAFETADMALLTRLLRRDVQLEMPPIPTWFSGYDAVLAFLTERAMEAERRFVPIRANGCPAVGAYTREADGRLRAHSIQVLETRDGAIERIYAFLEPRLFAAFGLPDVLLGE